MDGTINSFGTFEGTVGSSIGSSVGNTVKKNEEIFDRVWEGMGLMGSIPLSEVCGLLENIDMVGNTRRRMTNDPGVVLTAQTMINRVQYMFGKEATGISILKEDSIMMLEWIVNEGAGETRDMLRIGTYMADGMSGNGRQDSRFSVYDSDDTSDDETASLMEFGTGCRRSLSIPSSICDIHIDIACSTKTKGFNLRDALDDIEDHHLKIEMKFIGIDRQLDELKRQNAYHLKYLRNVANINDGSYERVKHIRHEIDGVKKELTTLSEVVENKPVNALSPGTQIDLVGTTMSPEDNQVYERLTKITPSPTSSSASSKHTPTNNMTTIIVLISIIIFLISFFTSK